MIFSQYLYRSKPPVQPVAALMHRYIKNPDKFKRFRIFCRIAVGNFAAMKKESIEKYGYWGLFTFVAIPLPGTGAWTGALIASMLGMNKKKSFFTIALGVLVAGIIMTILSYGILKGIFN